MSEIPSGEVFRQEPAEVEGKERKEIGRWATGEVVTQVFEDDKLEIETAGFSPWNEEECADFLDENLPSGLAKSIKKVEFAEDPNFRLPAEIKIDKETGLAQLRVYKHPEDLSSKKEYEHDICHELGHLSWTKLKPDSKASWITLPLVNEEAKVFLEMGFPNYAPHEKSEEFFAQAYAAFRTDPAAFKRAFPSIYAATKNVLEGAFGPDLR